MNILNKILYITIFTFLIVNIQSFAQKTKEKEKEKPKPKTRILFVFDASQSMYGRWQSDVKINIAQKLFAKMLDSLKNITNTENIELALRVYGHLKDFPPQDCDDTKLEVPFGKNNINSIKYKLRTLIPRGTTPIAASLEHAATDFYPCDNCRNIVILITDGIEECNGDPCAVSQMLQKKGIFLKPFVIGIGRDFKADFECVGNYYDATSEQSFRTALNVVISQALNSTTTQVNLLDYNGRPTETNVNMTFYDHVSGQIKYNFMHTLNNRGLPDTLVIDPLATYDLVVHTIPSVRKDSIKLVPGKHTIIPIDAPQGYLSLKMGGKLSGIKNIQCLVRQSGKCNTINVHTFDQVDKYLVGKYELEVMCLPRMIIKDVEVLQSHTTTVEIPTPGIVSIMLPSNGYGSVYVEDKNELKWIYNLRDNLTTETMILQPGNYRVIYRAKPLTDSDYTSEKSFKVDSGVSIQVKF